MEGKRRGMGSGAINHMADQTTPTNTPRGSSSETRANAGQKAQRDANGVGIPEKQINRPAGSQSSPQRSVPSNAPRQSWDGRHSRELRRAKRNDRGAYADTNISENEDQGAPEEAGKEQDEQFENEDERVDTKDDREPSQSDNDQSIKDEVRKQFEKENNPDDKDTSREEAKREDATEELKDEVGEKNAAEEGAQKPAAETGAGEQGIAQPVSEMANPGAALRESVMASQAAEAVAATAAGAAEGTAAAAVAGEAAVGVGAAIVASWPVILAVFVVSVVIVVVLFIVGTAYFCEGDSGFWGTLASWAAQIKGDIKCPETIPTVNPDATGAQQAQDASGSSATENWGTHD